MSSSNPSGDETSDAVPEVEAVDPAPRPTLGRCHRDRVNAATRSGRAPGGSIRTIWSAPLSRDRSQKSVTSAEPMR